MRPALAVALLATILSAFRAFAEEDTEYLIWTHHSRHQQFEWHFHLKRILATPEWNIEQGPVPLEPSKAWQTAKKWMQKYGCDKPELISIQISPLFREDDIGKLDPRLKKRFYYTVRCIPAYLDIMVVYVLMDGTILEPEQEPHKDMW